MAAPPTNFAKTAIRRTDVDDPQPAAAKIMSLVVASLFGKHEENEALSRSVLERRLAKYRRRRRASPGGGGGGRHPLSHQRQVYVLCTDEQL